MELDSKNTQESFSYFELKSTREIHIFQGEFTKENGCTIGNVSLCSAYSTIGNKVNIIKLCLKKEHAQKMVKTIDKGLCCVCVERILKNN